MPKVGQLVEKKRKAFFFEKKNQKTFIYRGADFLPVI